MDRVDELIAQLQSPALQDRILAAQALGEIGPGAARVYVALRERLISSEDAAELKAVALAIARVAPDMLRGDIQSRSNRKDADASREWARTLNEAQAREKIHNLLWACEDDDPSDYTPELHREAAAMLMDHAEMLPDLVDMLVAKMPPKIVAEILYVCARNMPEAETVLLSLRNHDDAEVAEAAGHVIERMNAESVLQDDSRLLVALAVEHPGVIPDLIDVLLNQPLLRRRLGLVLGFVLYERPEVADSLIPLLYSDDAEPVQVAANALYGVEVDGDRARALTEALLSLLDRSKEMGLEAYLPEISLIALHRGPGGQVAVEMVLASIYTAPAWDESYVRYNLLGSMANDYPSGPACDALLRLMADEKELARAGAFYGVGNAKEARITQACLSALLDASAEVRKGAAGVITIWDKERVAGVKEQLIDRLKGCDADVAGRIARALGKLGPEARDALPALKEWHARVRERCSRIVQEGCLDGSDEQQEIHEAVSNLQDAIEKIEARAAD